MDDLLEELDSFDRATPADRDRRRRFIATAAICGLAFVGIGQLATGAIFDDSANASVTYTTGDVEIEANGQASATLTAASNLAPGDTTYRPVSVTNVGSLDLRYAVSGITTSETKNLSNALRYTIYRGMSVAECNAGNTASGTAIVSNATIGTPASVVMAKAPLRRHSGAERP
jgi:spore coat-associated protein N